jgi:hypothetical protein
MSAAAAAKTMATLIAANLRAIKTIEAAIRPAIKDNPDARHKAGQIRSARGAGSVLAAELIGAMPELAHSPAARPPVWPAWLRIHDHRSTASVPANARAGAQR